MNGTIPDDQMVELFFVFIFVGQVQRLFQADGAE
jgi:hypothetical protein